MAAPFYIYLAGPDCFFPDHEKRYDRLKKLCADLGMVGISPLDNALVWTEDSKHEAGRCIARSNFGKIDASHGILANITPFRGPSCDVGTAVEVGYGYALDRVVVGYTEDMRPYKKRVQPDGLTIEDFEMTDNLMVHCACNVIEYTPAAALVELRRILELKLILKERS